MLRQEALLLPEKALKKQKCGIGCSDRGSTPFVPEKALTMPEATESDVGKKRFVFFRLSSLGV